MKKKKKRRQNKIFAPAPRAPVNPLQQRIEIINTMKPIVEAAKRTAARQREIKNKKEQEKNNDSKTYL